MSIFELPTSFERVEPRTEHVTADELPRRGFDPRSVQIAGAVTAALVALGLLVSNSATPDAVRPVVSSRVAPGAAAVETSEGAQGAVPVPPPAPTPAPPVNAEADQPAPAPPPKDNKEAPAWPDAQKLDGSIVPDGTKWDRKPDKGHGHWR